MKLPSRRGAGSGLTAGPGVRATSPGSGLTRVGVWAVGVVLAGAPVAGVRACSATSPFDGVTVGLGGVQTCWEGVLGLSGRRGAGLVLTKGNGGLVEWKSLALGTGPIDPSVSIAQSNRHGSCGVTLCAA
jgi:hypothetical protein